MPRFHDAARAATLASLMTAAIASLALAAKAPAKSVAKPVAKKPASPTLPPADARPLFPKLTHAPLPGRLVMAGSFGEHRNSHIHAGVDGMAKGRNQGGTVTAVVGMGDYRDINVACQ